MEYLKEYLDKDAEQKSSVDLNGLRKIRNSMHDCVRDLLRPFLQALHAPAHVAPTPFVQGKIGGIGKKSSLESTKYRKNGNDLYAKKNHDKIDHKMILHLYTKSIAYAPQDSEELALAYSNRSVLWLHIKRYDLCLIDVHRALEITKSGDLKVKLLSRQVKCVGLDQGVKNEYRKLKLPDFKSSKSVPCASDSIALVYNEKYGRHYIAKRNIRAGEVVLKESSSFIKVKNDQIYLVCAHCLAFAWAGIPCNFCVFTVYCSENCKKEAWDQYHDVMCPKLPTLHSIAKLSLGKTTEDVFDIVNMSTRMIAIFSKREGIETVLKEAEEIDKPQGQAVTNVSKDVSDCKKFKTLYSLSNCKIINRTEPTSLFTIRDKLTYIMNANSFKFVTVPTGSDEPSSYCECDDFESCLKSGCTNRGSIIGPCSSLMNHSCMPNVMQVFLPGPKIVLVTERQIKKGEQLFVCYGPHAKYMGTDSRQDILRKSYIFDCQCKACIRKLPDCHPPKIPNASTKRKIRSQLIKTFGKYADMLDEPAENWQYSEDLFGAAVKMCEFVYDQFDEWEAFTLSPPYRYYLHKCFVHLYSEDADDLPNTC